VEGGAAAAGPIAVSHGAKLVAAWRTFTAAVRSTMQLAEIDALK
jgi:hypothetical protein